MSPAGPVGYFIIDSVDSLLLFGLKDEYERAREFVKTLSFDLDDKFHNFEITIRVLGGLLSAYHLSGEDKLFLDKAVDLADRLLPVFDTVRRDSPRHVPIKHHLTSQGLTFVAFAAFWHSYELC